MTLKRPQFLITIGEHGHDCRVEVDGKDISKCLTGIVVSAFVDKPTKVILYGFASASIAGEPETVVGRLRTLEELRSESKS